MEKKKEKSNTAIFMGINGFENEVNKNQSCGGGFENGSAAATIE